MTLNAGFAQIDVTPPPGTAKIGWLRLVTINRIADPIFARVAVFRTPARSIGFVQLDTLCVRWSTAEQIRRRITEQFGFPGQNVMVSATHNHAGPAVANVADVPRDEAYLATLVDRCVQAFGEALARCVPATVGFARKAVFGLSYNRRTVVRGGLVRTQTKFTSPDALYSEGPVDPELAVIAVRDTQGKLLGSLVNFTCHPVHHGGDDACSGGWPGELCRSLQAMGCPVALFLNGAAGDIQSGTATGLDVDLTMQAQGQALARHAIELIALAPQRHEARIAAASTTVQLDYREPTDDQVRGTAIGAQRFVDPAIYDRHMPALIQRIAKRKTQPAQVQTLFINDTAFVSIPAEYFCQLGLNIKAKTPPRHTLIVGFANGMVGYVPTRDAFSRGGYETTFAGSSRMAPDSGDRLADAAIELINNHTG